MTRVVGVDLSLTSTGLADADGCTDRMRTKPDKGADALLDNLNRIANITRAVMDFAAFGEDEQQAALVVVEGPAFSRGAMGGQHVRAGLWWTVAAGLTARTMRVLVVPPSTRAMYATGRGNAGKDEVLAAAIKRYPHHDITGNDVADAVILAAIGARLLGHPIEDSLPKANERAMAKVALP